MNQTPEDIAELLCLHACKCKDNGQFPLSEISLRRAIALYPTKATLWSNLGVLLFNQNKNEEAEAALKKAIELFKDDDNCQSFTNYGILLSALRRPDEAAAMFDEAIEKEPRRVAPKWEIANLALEEGDWKRGFEYYRHRKLFKGRKYYPKLPYPDWDGKADLNGKTIFIQPEQGMGDRILFSRYLVWLKEKYPDCHIIYAMEPKEMSFFWGYRDYIELIPFGVPFPKCDYACFQLDLPGFHGTTPDNVPSDPGLFLKRVVPGVNIVPIPKPNLPSFKIGICWTGNPAQNLNHFRTIPLEIMLQLAENPNITLHSLHTGKGKEDIKRVGAEEVLYDFSDDLEKRGYVATGEYMMNMDLIVTCCTSVAHLAGVLKVPCFTMLCYAPFWVWMREREDSVWYPNTMKLFRQSKPGDWQPVMDKVKAEVNAMVAQKIPFLTKEFDK